MTSKIAEQIQRARRELLDLTARNRLLNTPLNRTRSSRLDIDDELTSEVFRILVQERREMSFLPVLPDEEPEINDAEAHEIEGSETEGDATEISATEISEGEEASGDPTSIDADPTESADSDPSSSNDTPPSHLLAASDAAEDPTDPTSESESDERSPTDSPGTGLTQPTESEEPADRHVDSNLQTKLPDDQLHTKLLRLFYDARSLADEQGVNSLFCALGFLEWYEEPNSEKVRFAPLLLVPIELHRRTVNAKFRVRYLDDEPSTNLSLKEKLKAEFGLQLPEVPELDDLDPAAYFDAVEQVISNQPNWRLHRDRQTIWFFSFAKFLMFRDLDPETWPTDRSPVQHRLLRGLLGEPIEFDAPKIGEDESLDDHIDARKMTHVMDADSSQAAAIEEVRNGRNLVIQGPPGTGKSQSITNVIAAAVKDGKTVLFVAEKLAALDVVKSRLNRIGLGGVCLELHSHKANRKVVLSDLNDTLELTRPKLRGITAQATRLRKARKELNEYVEQLHAPVEPSEQTPYQLMGTLTRFQGAGVKPFRAKIDGLAEWTAADLDGMQSQLKDVALHIEQVGTPRDHAWFGVRRTSALLPSELQAIERKLSTLHEQLTGVLRDGECLASVLTLASASGAQVSMHGIQRLVAFAENLRSIPDMDREAFANDVWSNRRADVARVLERGREHAECRGELDGVLAAVAWKMPVAQTRVDLAATGQSWFRWFNSRWRNAQATLRGMSIGRLPTDSDKQIEILDTLDRGQTLARDLSSGPLNDIGSSAFGNHWHGPESDWDQLQRIAHWDDECRKADAPDGFRQAVRAWSAVAETREAEQSASASLQTATAELQSFCDVVQLSVDDAFGHERFADVDLSTLIDRVSAWRDSTGSLGRWIVFRHQLEE
ncbi:MAG: DUF4011 domain-containing protein, partial [Planctomycetota bacterium]|nr:DUF4011 domain-containing protein [Planctomycetota bacterium]